YGVVRVSMPGSAARVESLEHLFKQIRSPLMSYAHSIILNDQDAQDVVQEVFAECWADGRDVTRAYLFRSVRNRSYNRIRGHKRWQVMLRRLQQHLAVLSSTSREETKHALIHDALARLPAKQREVLLLRIKSELKISEI